MLKAAKRIQTQFRGRLARKYASTIKLHEYKKQQQNLGLQALWQILITGFEVIK